MNQLLNLLSSLFFRYVAFSSAPATYVGSTLLDSFLDFVEFVTMESPTLRTAFVEAGILALQPYRDSEFWQRFHYIPSVFQGGREKLVQVMDEEKEVVLRLLSQQAAGLKLADS